MTGTVALRTEFDFSLPAGFVDERGDLHRTGTMRLATALDEVEPFQDPRVIRNQAYLGILVLSRVITRLGDISPVDPQVIEQLFSSDFAFLQDLYIRINDLGNSLIETECPNCGSRFTLDIAS